MISVSETTKNVRSKLRFAIIGAGKIGERHALHIHQRAYLAAFCDTQFQKARQLSEKYDAFAFDSLEKLLERSDLFDVAVICTPNGLHAEQSVLCLEKNKHVVCEKPMALRSLDCSRMIQTATYHNRKLFVVKQNRYNPPVVAVNSLMEENRLGKIHGVQLNCFWNRDDGYYAQESWRGTKDLDGGTLYTQFSHFIDLMLWIMNDEVIQIQSMAGNLMHQNTIDFEDTGVVNLRFSKGSIGSIYFTINSYRKNMEGSLTLFGEKGTIKIGGEYLNQIVYQEIEGGPIELTNSSLPANQYGAYSGSMSNHGLFYDNVMDVLENGAAMTTNAGDALKTVELIERIYAAIHES